MMRCDPVPDAAACPWCGKVFTETFIQTRSGDEAPAVKRVCECGLDRVRLEGAATRLVVSQPSSHEMVATVPRSGERHNG